MIVKIGEEIYDSRNGDLPMMVVLSKKEKEQIQNMSPSDARYMIYPDGMKPEELKNWVGDCHAPYP